MEEAKKAVWAAPSNLLSSENLTFADSQEAEAFCKAIGDLKNVSYFCYGHKVQVKTFIKEGK